MSVNVVDQTSPSEEIGEWLISHGYGIGTSSDLASRPSSTDFYTVFAEASSMVKGPRIRIGFMRYLQTYRRRVKGWLYFNNKSLGATPKKWVLWVWGRDLRQEMESLADQMAHEFKVKIKVVVKTGQRLENFLDDFPGHIG